MKCILFLRIKHYFFLFYIITKHFLTTLSFLFELVIRIITKDKLF